MFRAVFNVADDVQGLQALAQQAGRDLFAIRRVIGALGKG